ncbi:lysophospholipid acyltransferase family protein [Desulfofustis glycolicus]|uniref:Predicted acyltransferase, LPLAT superfamily n=1 Tax=Desulfofustis glycolicus DSM 9705 TaxID=1121409 RepID=A0A1M5UNN9_9BACT|nr:lysophospholipid acyltransferase family protein [Desulfofustis glycolicus]MCB2217390.1 lysophospholipid acyltransferase family protein [Desulfobulbaceae bacterium]SHH64506.1 Predicted acyltransferase, LPLAT superfamily [Desulfofustis glycolicus DSM 9705]
MTGRWYRLLHFSGRVCGAWSFALVARIIAAGYFLFSTATAESNRFYATLFPGRSSWYHRWCTFRQYQNFTTIHLDRFLSSTSRSPSFTSAGWGQLTDGLGRSGGILLMSHLGNWELAAQLLKERQRDRPVLLYMGVKEQEGVERTQKEALRRAGVTIVGVDRGASSPFSVVEGVNCLRRGGIVSLTGDLLWNDGQRQVAVDFLGGRAFLPAAPYIFALVAGAPLFAFFSFRTGRNSYEFSLSEPIVIPAVSRDDREAAITRAAQQYADLLVEALHRHPLEWYHFERFVH